MNRQSGVLSPGLCALYVAPTIPAYLLIIPMYIVQGVYAKHYGIALTTLAAIGLISRLLDIISDPLVGHLSDRYHARHGTRLPFMLCGGAGLLVCGYFLFNPPELITPFYFGCWFVGIYTAFTLFEIPHASWPSDYSTDSDVTTQLFSYRVFANYAALVIFYSIPMLPVFETEEINPEKLRLAFAVALLLAIPCFIKVLVTPSLGTTVRVRPVGKKTAKGISSIEKLKIIAKNRVLLLFLSAYVCTIFSIQMWYGLAFIYIDVYLGMGEAFAKIFFLAFVIGLVLTPVWHRIILRFGKKASWVTASILSIASYAYTGTLEPGETTFSQLLLLKTVQSAGLIGMTILAPAWLADIIDYSSWKYRTEKSSGVYFSLKVFSEKLGYAGGPALALMIVGFGGFDATALVQTDLAIASLKFAIVWMPITISLLGLLLMAFNPINHKRHATVAKYLGRRLARGQ